MKKILYILPILLLALTACSGYRPGNLNLQGDCKVEKIVMNDSIEGRIDLAQRSIEMALPEVYDNSRMTVSELQLSEGATANVTVGEALDLRTPQVVRVKNGDVFIDWTVSALNEVAEILYFRINGVYPGIIDSKALTITVYVPSSLDVKALTPIYTLSKGASCTPVSGSMVDFSSPVHFLVTNGSAKKDYTVTVVAIDKPQALYVGLAPTMPELPMEEYTACTWMLSNVPSSLYASWDEVRNGKLDLSECKVIWWHFHKDGGVNGAEAFEIFAPAAVSAVPALQTYINNGGSLLLSRYATHLASYLSINGEEPCERFPNNCWGGDEQNAETTGGPWSFHTDSIQHPIYAGLADIAGGDVFTCDAGYRITNSTAQWHIGSDWGGYASHDFFREKMKASILGYGGDQAVTVWEWKRSAQNGGVLCIGTGCYDWYSVDEVYTGYHDNVLKLTSNAFNYLKQ